MDGEAGRDGDPGRGEHGFRPALVHAQGARAYAGAGEHALRRGEKALDRAILSLAAVQAEEEDRPGREPREQLARRVRFALEHPTAVRRDLDDVHPRRPAAVSVRAQSRRDRRARLQRDLALAGAAAQKHSDFDRHSDLGPHCDIGRRQDGSGDPVHA